MSLGLRDGRCGERRYTADVRSAGRKRWSWDQASVPLPRRRTIRIRCRVTGHASTCKLIAVGIRSCNSVRKCLEEGNDLVLLLIGQTEITGCHIDIVLDFGHWPAIYLFDSSCRAVS